MDTDGWVTVEQIADYLTIQVDEKHNSLFSRWRFVASRIIRASTSGTVLFACASTMSVSSNLVKREYGTVIFTTIASPLLTWCSLIGSLLFVWSFLRRTVQELKGDHNKSWYEKIILLLWGKLLSSDSLQFGYKAASSTTQASWLVHEVLTHYLREGSHPICGLLDCSRAFDLAKWDKMFSQVLLRKVPAIVTRAMIYSYQEQYAWCRCGKEKSQIFPLVNGTR